MGGCCQYINCLMGSHKPGLDGDREIARGRVSKKNSWVKNAESSLIEVIF